MSQNQPGNSSKIVGISDYGLVWLCYVLHTLSIFFGGVTSVISVFINYLKRDSEDEIVRSHMNWQIKTFWMAVLFAVILAIGSFLLYMSMVGVFLVYPMWLGYVLWFAYRQIKGMLALNNGRTV